MARWVQITLVAWSAALALRPDVSAEESPPASAEDQAAVLKEYAERAAACAETADAQVALAAWCDEVGLADLRRVHLERAIGFDPDHAQARKALGFRLVGGEWLTEEQVKQRAGLVWYDGKWRTAQAVELLEEKKQRDRAERGWIRQLARVRKTLQTSFELGRQRILEIQDPAAVTALTRAMTAEHDPRVREIYARALARIGSPAAVKELVWHSLHDPDDEVRLACVDELRIGGFADAAALYLPALRHADNAVVNRAAVALGELRATQATGPLIDAVVTRHTYKLPQPPPGQTNVGFGSGSGGVGGGLSMGSRGPQKVTISKNNQSVVDALEAITGVNFGFDVSRWRAWHRATQPPGENLDIRRD